MSEGVGASSALLVDVLNLGAGQPADSSEMRAR
jgi:hypothetical protein